jgi:polyphosphate kinase 2 (PPK2 family)
VDLLSRKRWFDYSCARDLMFKTTDTKEALSYILHSDDKKRPAELSRPHFSPDAVRESEVREVEMVERP